MPRIRLPKRAAAGLRSTAPWSGTSLRDLTRTRNSRRLLAMGKRYGPLHAAMRQGFCALLMVVILALPARGQDGEIDYGRARAMMVQMIQIEALLSSDVTGIDQIDARILEVMAEVPRHAFVPAELQPYAYGSHPLPVGHAQNLAAPFLVALMTHLADPKPGDVVFETGTGAGYHARAGPPGRRGL